MEKVDKRCNIKEKAAYRFIVKRYAALAEGVGFEPTERCRSAVFKTAALDLSATLPFDAFYYKRNSPPCQGNVPFYEILRRGDNRWLSPLIYGAVSAQ